MYKANRVSASILALAAAAVILPTPSSAQTLEEALAQAYAGNPRLLSERAALRAVDEGVATAKSGWRPTVEINGAVGKSYSANETESTGRVSSQSTLPASAGINLSQPLYRYGGDDSGVLDGGLFVFVQGTDPEVFLLIEARRPRL